jgi:Arc/MetJ-type ribon-helix-helix transcriptional regulator
LAETEKITINISVVDLGQIDLLVDEGFYSNRTDFIRTAIRRQIDSHAREVKETIIRRSFGLGAWSYNQKELEAARQSGQKYAIKVVGMVSIANDVSPELADESIESIEVYGVLNVSAPVRIKLASKIK